MALARGRPATSRQRRGPRPRSGSGIGRPSTRCSSASRSSRKPVPPASTTPASLSTGSMLRRAGEGVVALRLGRLEHRDEVAAAVGSRHRGLGRLADDGEDRALDRAHHRLVGRLGGGGEGAGRRWAPSSPAGIGDHRRQAPEDLGQDHPRVPSGPHERAVADGLAHGGEVPARQRSSSSLTASEGERHVGPGVAVGHRVDVEPVDALLVRGRGRPGTRPRRLAARRRPGA